MTWGSSGGSLNLSALQRDTRRAGCSGTGTSGSEGGGGKTGGREAGVPPPTLHIPFDQTAGNHFFRFIATAYETRSLVLSSNWPFEEWTNFLPDTTTATAILDRLPHHADVVVVSGDSVRLKEARENRERHSGSDPPKSEPL